MELADGNPALLAPYLDDVRRSLTSLSLIAIALSLVLAVGWLVVVQRDPPYGEETARSKLGLWVILLVALVLGIGGLVWLRFLDDPVSGFVEATIGTTALLLLPLVATLAYWVSTAAFVRPASRPSVPLAQTIFGRS